MNQRASIAFVLCSITFACSSSETTSPGGAKGSAPPPSGTVIAPVPSTTTSTGDASTPMPSSTSSPSTGTGACGGQTTGDACYECCDQQNAAGATAYGNLLTASGTCQCQACATQCAATACASTPTEPPAGSPCETCIANATACEDKLEQDCNANASCAALLKCYETSKCDEKN